MRQCEVPERLSLRCNEYLYLPSIHSLLQPTLPVFSSWKGLTFSQLCGVSPDQLSSEPLPASQPVMGSTVACNLIRAKWNRTHSQGLVLFPGVECYKLNLRLVTSWVSHLWATEPSCHHDIHHLGVLIMPKWQEAGESEKWSPGDLIWASRSTHSWRWSRLLQPIYSHSHHLFNSLFYFVLLKPLRGWISHQDLNLDLPDSNAHSLKQPTRSPLLGNGVRRDLRYCLIQNPFISQMRRLRPGEVEGLPWSHTAGLSQNLHCHLHTPKGP